MALVVFIFQEEGRSAAVLGDIDETTKKFASAIGCKLKDVLERIEIKGKSANVIAELGLYDSDGIGVTLSNLVFTAYLAGQKSKSPA